MLPLAFELERGGEIDAQASLPTVWPVAAALRSAELLRHFEADWAAWYGPLLAPHAAAIAAQLAEEAALAQRLGGLPGTEHPLAWGGPVQQPERSGRLCAVQLPLWWAFPVLRKRSRRLRISTTPADIAALWPQVQPLLTPEWRGQAGLSLRLELETRLYWGAMAERTAQPGGVRWRPCRVRADAVTALPPASAEAVSALERRLRGGVGLLVVVPVLLLERPPPAAGPLHRGLGQGLHQGLRHLRRRLGAAPLEEREPGLVQRWWNDEAWWARAWPAARLGEPALRRALKQGALLQPASRLALRHAAGGLQKEHVLLLHGGQASVRSNFGDLLVADPGTDARVEHGPLWPGLPLLDAVATWRFEHDGWRAIDARVAALAAAIKQQILGPAAAGRGGGRTGGRIVLLAHGQGGLVARFALDAWRERWAALGWRVEAITLGTPHLGSSVPQDRGCRLMLGAAVDAAACAAGSVSRASLAERVRQERWWAQTLPPGLADAQPDGVRRLAGGDAARLPPGLWLLGGVWGAPDLEGASLRPTWLVDDPAERPATGDGFVARDSALAGRTPITGAAGPQPPPDDGVLAFDVSPVTHASYLAQPAARQVVQRGLLHLLGREGSWA